MSTPITDSAMKALMTQMAAEQPTQSTTPPEKGVSKLAYLAPWLGAAADLGTTAYALQNDAYETNPLLGQNIGKIAALKALSTLGTMGAMKLLGKSHPKIATALGYGSGMTQGVVAAQNIHEVSKAKK